MPKRNMRRCSISLIIREMQMKTTMRYHRTPLRMAIIKKPTKNKHCRGCGEKRTLLHCWWECKLIQPLWRTVWRFLTKLKIKLPYSSSSPTPECISGEKHSLKGYMHSNVHCSTVYNSQDMETT